MIHYCRFAQMVSLVLIVTIMVWLTGTIHVFAFNNDRVTVLVAFSSHPQANDRALIARHGGTVTQSYQIVPALAVEIPKQAVASLARNPRVIAVEPDGLMTLISPSPTGISDTAFTNELNNTWGVEHIGTSIAHQNGYFGTLVKVGVLDTGIDYTHPELAAIYAGGYNFISKSNDAKDDNNHGTHVAGTIAAARDGVGVVGVTPDVVLYGLKAFAANGSATFSDIIAAIDWAVIQNIDVLNHSYGSPQDPGTIFRQAFDNSAAAGILHIAAAGNTGQNNGRGDNVNFPARYNSVVAVAATNQNNTRASFSSTGPALAISAPGVSIPSTITNKRYASFSGTSMASPHVAGAAALIRSIHPSLTPAEVTALLINTAIPLGNNNHFGAGLVDIPRILAAVLPPKEDTLTEDESPAEDTPVSEPPIDEDPIDTINASIGSIIYTTSGGRLNDRHLSVSVPLTSNNGPVSGATITAQLYRNTTMYASFSGITNSAGTITASFSNAPGGTYHVKIVSLNLPDGYVWDEMQPTNTFVKN